MGWENKPAQAAADAVLAVLDDDLAAPVRALPVERRITDADLLAIQQIRLLRALLEKLNERDQGSEARRYG